MQELEKILEEIEHKKWEHIGKDYIPGSGDIVNGLDMAMEIIRKHMNDGWIPVEERLPEECQKAWESGYDEGYDDGYALGITQPI